MYPIFLNAATTLAEGATAVLDSGALQSPYRAPLLITGARFTLRGNPAIVMGPGAAQGKLPGAGYVEPGGSVRLQLRAGRFALTNGFIPVPLFGPQLQAIPWGDPAGYGIGQMPESIVGDGDQDGAAPVYCHYQWKFPRPLFLPAGTPLGAQAQRVSDGMGGSYTVNVGFTGKVLDADTATPSSISVPYVTAFVPGEGVANAQSSEMDLGNPFQIPLNVQRLCGRIRYRNTNSDGFGGLLMYDEGLSYYDAVTASIRQTAVQVKLQMNHGPTIVRDLTQFFDVFDASRKAWTFSTTLNPKQRIDAVVVGATTHEQPMISLVGHREEVL